MRRSTRAKICALVREIFFSSEGAKNRGGSVTGVTGVTGNYAGVEVEDDSIIIYIINNIYNNKSSLHKKGSEKGCNGCNA